MAEPIDLPFGLWTRVGLKEAQVQSHSPGGANVSSWEGTLAPLTNTILPSVCCGDATLCQITFTTCYYLSVAWLFELSSYIGHFIHLLHFIHLFTRHISTSVSFFSRSHFRSLSLRSHVSFRVFQALKTRGFPGQSTCGVAMGLSVSPAEGRT